MRVLGSLGLVGLWQAAASLGGPPALTALLTTGAGLAAVWALAVVRRP